MRLIAVMVLAVFLGCGGDDPAGPGPGSAGTSGGAAGASAGSDGGAAGSSGGSTSAAGASAAGTTPGTAGAAGQGGAGGSGSAGAAAAGTSGAAGTAPAYPTCASPFKGDTHHCSSTSGILHKSGMICVLCSTVPGGQTGAPANCVTPDDGTGTGGDLCVSDCHSCS